MRMVSFSSLSDFLIEINGGVLGVPWTPLSLIIVRLKHLVVLEEGVQASTLRLISVRC